MKENDDDSSINIEEKNFFELIENQKEEEIRLFLNKNSSCEIWNYKDKKDNSTVLHASICTDN
jgi:hypothetical protein